MKTLTFLTCVFLAGVAPFYGEMDSENEIHGDMSAQEKYGQSEEELERIRIVNEADDWRKKNCGVAEKLWEEIIKAKDDIIESDRKAYDRFEQARNDWETAKAELDAAKTRALPAYSGERQDTEAIKANLKPYQRKVYLAMVKKDNALFLFRKIRKIRKEVQARLKEDEKLYKPIEDLCQGNLDSYQATGLDADLTLAGANLEHFKHSYSDSWHSKIGAAYYQNYLKCERDAEACREQEGAAKAREAGNMAPGGMHHR